MITKFFKGILKIEQRDQEAEEIKKKIYFTSTKTTQKIDKLNIILGKDKTYNIARAMGLLK